MRLFVYLFAVASSLPSFALCEVSNKSVLAENIVAIGRACAFGQSLEFEGKFTGALVKSFAGSAEGVGSYDERAGIETILKEFEDDSNKVTAIALFSNCVSNSIDSLNSGNKNLEEPSVSAAVPIDISNKDYSIEKYMSRSNPDLSIVFSLSGICDFKIEQNGGRYRFKIFDLDGSYILDGEGNYKPNQEKRLGPSNYLLTVAADKEFGFVYKGKISSLCD